MLNKVAIIILNWNNYKDTTECLLSVDKLEYKPFCVFLVDNHSHDRSFEKLKEDYERHRYNMEIVFIQSGENLGFAGGNNIALEQAYDQGYSYFWLLNNDTIVLPDSLTYLAAELDANPKAGMAGSKIYYYGTQTIWFAGGEINTYTGRAKHPGIGEFDRGQYDARREVDYITGCSLLVRREVIESVGLMKKEYFFYYEEAEWNLRARNAGWERIYRPDSRIFHKVSVSTGGEKKKAPFVAFYDIRNAYWMIKGTQRNKIKIGVSFLYKYYKALRKIVDIYRFNQNNKLIRVKYIIKGLLLN
ncbi:glycosyltransferase family 2 protein [Terrilactibacillus sp. S3-3]|nr:glycosyltransferase family 2 protein [Terrilactibacillus sp. S3-3]